MSRRLWTLPWLALCVACGESQLSISQPSAPTAARAGSQGTGIFALQGEPRLLSYDVVEGRAMYQGDISLGPVPDAETGSSSQGLGAVALDQLWPDRTVFYEFDPGFTAQGDVMAAIAHWQERTKMRFVPRTNQSDYVRIFHGTGCWSVIGRAGGKQDLSLEKGACGASVAIHELGHAVGLAHEQSRFDRDAFVDIFVENIAEGQESNFGVSQAPIGPYDLSSVMHYFSTEFSGNGKPTILRKGGAVIPWAEQLSAGDIAGVEALYNPRSPCSLSGAIAAKYEAIGGARLLGKCVTDVLSTQDGAGQYSHFYGGSIYSTQELGAHFLYGPLRDVWAIFGWEKGLLGYPVSDPQFTADQSGYFVNLQRGAIYWNLPRGRAFEVHGAILGKWREIGAEAGPLGLPLTHERTTPDGVGRYNHFEHGSVYWTPTTGAHSLQGAIRERWASMGWERSALGYPVSDEHDVPGGRQSDFQRGSILWNSATGEITVKQ